MYHSLMTIMTLLDCAFSFFANIPCRLSISEMNYDLPCDDDIFSSPHPFAERSAALSRNITTMEAFQSLFKPTPPNQGQKGNPLDLNPMDMFVLIHRRFLPTPGSQVLTPAVLYVSAHYQITHFPGSVGRSPSSSGTSTPAGQPAQADSNMLAIKNALSRWRSLWSTIRSNIPSNSWASLGFYRNGYNYWLVTQLIITAKGSAEILLGMEVGCEDTLKQLKGLLKDGVIES